MSTFNVKEDELKPQKNIKRINKLPIFIGVALLSLVAVAFLSLMNASVKKNQAKHQERNGLYVDSKDAQLLQAENINSLGKILEQPEATGAIIGQRLLQSGATEEQIQEIELRIRNELKAQFDELAARRSQLSPEEEMRLQRERDRLKRLREEIIKKQEERQKQLESAVVADTSVIGESADQSLGANAAGTSLPAVASLETQREQFLKRDYTVGYLDASVRKPLSRYELLAGSVIPAILISEAVSSLPGSLSAQVSEHVYDSKTGEYLLIPQGTKLYGSYNSETFFGEKRLQVVWHRLTFPDGTKLDLKAMAGAEAAGSSGLIDKVENNYGQIFGSAFLLSLIGSAGEIIRRDSDNDNDQDIIIQNTSDEFEDVGEEIVERYLNIKPRIEIRPGKRLNVMVNKDIILKPYRKSAYHLPRVSGVRK